MNFSARSRCDSRAAMEHRALSEVVYSPKWETFSCHDDLTRCAFVYAMVCRRIWREPTGFGTPANFTQGSVLSCRRSFSAIFHEMFIGHLR